MKLELKYLAPYSPYELKIKHNFKKVRYNSKGELKDWIRVLEPSMLNCFTNKTKTKFNYKPILRPLSDLTKEIEHNGKKFVPLDIICQYHTCKISDGGIVEEVNDKYELLYLPYKCMKFLFEWHFDVFGLIDEGLAIDINTL